MLPIPEKSLSEYDLNKSKEVLNKPTRPTNLYYDGNHCISFSNSIISDVFVSDHMGYI